MLKNKWIIAEKEPCASDFLYTLILVDCNPQLYKTERHHVLSNQNLQIGDFVDYNLNPLTQQYKDENADIARVEFANTYNIGSKELKKVELFGNCFGCIYTFVQRSHQEIPLRRGDTISLFMFNKLPYNTKGDFKMMENLTTGDKTPYFDNVLETRAGVLTDAVIVGVGFAGINETPANKGMLIYSEKFGYIYSTMTSNDILFFTRTGDELLIERKPKTNQFEILRNITADKIRSQYISNKR